MLKKVLVCKGFCPFLRVFVHKKSAKKGRKVLVCKGFCPFLVAAYQSDCVVPKYLFQF
jgi:hypothetical protein